MDRWVAEHAGRIARHAERELEALVGVSSPSGDREGAEEALALCAALLPSEAAIERPPCSSPDHAPDLVARLRGSGTHRVLLLGHVDTVVAHDGHRPLKREGDRMMGSGAVDMKAGVVLSLGAMRSLAQRQEAYAEVALLLVTDEEWRVHAFGHTLVFERFDACLCFEAGEAGPNGEEGVVVRRKAAGTLRVEARGASAHSGSAPDAGRNALLALARVAEMLAGFHDPGGSERLTVVPTVMRSGNAFNVVPGVGDLVCDLRADTMRAFAPVVGAVPAEIGGVELEATMVRSWPGMDTRSETADLLEGASRRVGRPVVGVERGGASDASHFASAIPLTLDGLGPIGGGAHTPGEHVLASSLPPRAETALALVAEALAIPPRA